MSNFLEKLTVSAPATVANLACGFDVLGLALDCDFHDELTVRLTNNAQVLEIVSIEGDEGKLPLKTEKNTAGVAAQIVYDKIVKKIPEASRYGVEIFLKKCMPFASGLGSSAASAVAGAYAINELFGSVFSKIELLDACVRGEEVADGALHADNVGPSLLGGITLVADNEFLDIYNIPVPEGLALVMIYPHITILTKDSRSVISSSVDLKNCVRQNANLGATIVALYNSNYNLLSSSMKDVIIEPQRQSLIPYFSNIQKAAFDAGALACSISGAGPSIFSLCKKENAQNIYDQLKLTLKKVDYSYDIFISNINLEGVKVI